MRSKHIVVVDDVEELLSSLERKLQSVCGNDYEVYGFTNAKDALEHIENEINANGNILALVASDEKMSGMQGHELLEAVGRTHSNTKRILYSGYTDYNALRKALNQGVDEFVQKADPNESSEGLYAVIDTQLHEFEKQPIVELRSENVALKFVDTLYERTRLFECRYVNYLGAGNLTKEDLTEEQNSLGQEWDEFDTDYTRYIVAKIGGTIIGGVRIIDGVLPMETATIDGTGELFSLDFYRNQGYHTREISRLILDYEHRTHQAEVLLGLFRMISHLTQDHDYMFCTSREKQIGLYKGIGFELLNAEGKPITGEEAPIILRYKLKGDWYPMVRSLTKIREEPRNIPGFSPNFHNDAIKQIEKANPEEWAKASQKLCSIAEETGYFTAFYVGDATK